ncbi:dual specificity tyrosine-phosphorylation-regulated kinase 3-like isoform X4 [Cucurbita maxima]|uniref:Dual specificity tyrosine-phosphorylation-regulated kinase 3-like isoform X4 n=1 Tax=Cucurbita maxima TaxID=3661 RepID=A0A6J1JN80_CUCMA|nr:dual specificity tyrosine-phosphorylation-regulated kinase 3-like isoform X4 [Cucurbita maxima]
MTRQISTTFYDFTTTFIIRNVSSLFVSYFDRTCTSFKNSIKNLVEMLILHFVGCRYVRFIARQCLEALEFLHHLGIIHCDLKPENILMKSYKRCEIKVIDLGSSCFRSDNLCLYVQSRSYRAPEVMLGLSYDPKIDLWSLGCILAELWSGEVLFPNEAVVMILARMIGLFGPINTEMLLNGQETHKYFTEENDLYYMNEETDQMELIIPEETSLEDHLQVFDSGFVDFLSNLLEIDPERRPTAKEALAHPWFSQSYE